MTAEELLKLCINFCRVNRGCTSVYALTTFGPLGCFWVKMETKGRLGPLNYVSCGKSHNHGEDMFAHIESGQRKRQQVNTMNAIAKKREYDAKLDSKKRLTVRGARTRHYHVTEYDDGTVELSPRKLVHPDEISRRTLEMMDKAMKNLKKGNVSKPVDMEELEELLGE